MGRRPGSLNVTTIQRIASSLAQVAPAKAIDLLNEMRSNHLWLVAANIAIEERDAKALVRILTFLDDKAFGKAAEKIEIDANISHHHTVESLETARNIAREILAYNPPPTIQGE